MIVPCGLEGINDEKPKVKSSRRGMFARALRNSGADVPSHMLFFASNETMFVKRSSPPGSCVKKLLLSASTCRSLMFPKYGKGPANLQHLAVTLSVQFAVQFAGTRAGYYSAGI